MAGYSGTPLVDKIGIKPGHALLLVNAPRNFECTLGDLPEGVNLTRNGKSFDVAIAFVTSASELSTQVESLRAFMEQNGMVWVAWPKKASGVATDLTEDTVREIGLAAGLVDVKVCAIDDTWSGLKFVIRVADRQKAGPARKIVNRTNSSPKRATKAKKTAAR